MLVLTREEGSSVLIGDHVTVTVESLGPDMARLCVACPPDLAVRLAGPGTGGPPTPLPPGDGAASQFAPPSASRFRVVLQPEQPLAIGPDIIVTVERIFNAGGHQPRARMGFRAPREMRIVRQEIFRPAGISPASTAPRPPIVLPAGPAAAVGQPELPA